MDRNGGNQKPTHTGDHTLESHPQTTAFDCLLLQSHVSSRVNNHYSYTYKATKADVLDWQIQPTSLNSPDFKFLHPFLFVSLDYWAWLERRYCGVPRPFVQNFGELAYTQERRAFWNLQLRSTMTVREFKKISEMRFICNFKVQILLPGHRC